MSEARVPWSGKAASLAAGGYPLRAIILLAAALVIAVLFAVLPVSRGLAWVVGTVVALMLPYVIWILAVWTVLFAAWYLAGLPWGL